MQTHAKTRLWIDSAIFVAYLVLMQPALTGIAIHEWLATAAIAGFVTHVLLQWDWLISVGRKLLNRWNRSRLNFVLDTGLWLAMTTAFVSGYAISHNVLPLLGISVQESFLWRRLHDLSANLTLLIVAVHIGLHWRWITSTIRRYILRQQSA